ncbi:MAG: beta-propeller fold lactonase family protein [Bryobacteraceae bacterium]|jgi:YVTN family beta-propeller protein
MTAQSTPAAFANFEASQTNPVRLSADGTRLYAVNTPNGSLSVFDVTTPGTPTEIVEIPVGVEPVSVSVNPATNDEAWVVNQVSNSISVVSVSKGIVTDTIPASAEPMDVVFAGANQAYVSISRNNQIAVFDTTTHALITTLDVFGGSPRALAVSQDGTKVYAAFAISGNATTLIPEQYAPPQCTPPPCVPAMNPALPAPPQVGLIVSANDPATRALYPQWLTYTMPDNDVVAINAAATPTIAAYYSGVGTINLGLAVSPTSGNLFVANTDALNTIHFENNLVSHFVNNRITRINVSSGLVTPVDLNPNAVYGPTPNPASQAIALAQPTSVVFDPSGAFMYVAAFGTDRVATVDTNGNVIGFVEIDPQATGSTVNPRTKRGPRGLALNAAANTLYCLNRISNSISVINTSTKAVSSEIAIGTDPTPAAIHVGRGFLYDAKLSGSGTGSCASCHVDGDMDHLAWDLGDPTQSMQTVTQGQVTVQFHPMKGPMTTQPLRGLSNLSPYHWRGDHVNFAAFNTAFVSLLGGTQLSTADMTAYTTFVDTILFLPNPNEPLDRTTLPTSFTYPGNSGNPAQGFTDFFTVAESTPGPKTCDGCHTANPGPGSNRAIEPLQQPQPLKTPQTRNTYQKLLFNRFGGAKTIDGFGMDHDGHVSLFTDFFNAKTFAGYSATQKADIGAYMMMFDTGAAPAVGFAETLTSTNVTNSTLQNNLATLELRAAAGDNDLIGRGTLNGVVHGLLYQPSTQNYIDDTSTLYTQAELVSLIKAGDTLTFMGVYPGTGTANKN